MRLNNSRLTFSNISLFTFPSFLITMPFSKVKSLSTLILLLTGILPSIKLELSTKTEYFESFILEVIPHVTISSRYCEYLDLDKIKTGLCLIPVKSEKGKGTIRISP